jgi:integrase/recombinase XerD
MKTQIYLSNKKVNARQLAPVYCRISQGEERAEISLGVFVNPKEFDLKTRLVKKKCPMAESFNKRIIQSHARIYDIITSLTNQGIYKPHLVREIFRNKKRFEIIDLNKTLTPFVQWCEHYIETRYTEKFKTRRNYSDALAQITKVEMILQTTITRIDKKTAKYIYDYLQNKGLLYYLAKIKYLSRQYHEHFEEENPIDRYRVTSKGKYEKGALSQEDLGKIIRYKPKNALSQIYMDIFLFQYFSAGSRVGDVLRMRWQDVGTDTLKRVEEKTGKERSLPINSAMKAILDKYRGHSVDYVFDLKQPAPTVPNEEWCHYKDRVLSNINSALRTIRKNLNLPTHISSHTSRHTFATHTFETTKDVKTTSLMMGHSKLATTEMYLHTSEQLPLDMFAQVYKEKEALYVSENE